MYVLNRNEPDVNFTYCGQTPLFIACNHGKFGVVQLLLRWPHPKVRATPSPPRARAPLAPKKG